MVWPRYFRDYITKSKITNRIIIMTIIIIIMMMMMMMMMMMIMLMIAPDIAAFVIVMNK